MIAVDLYCFCPSHVVKSNLLMSIYSLGYQLWRSCCSFTTNQLVEFKMILCCSMQHKNQHSCRVCHTGFLLGIINNKSLTSEANVGLGELTVIVKRYLLYKRNTSGSKLLLHHQQARRGTRE